MGNREWGKGGTIFRQSLGDFPLTVALGKNTPSFGLHRFKKGLRFVPPDDEGFSLRGDRRHLVYKGRRRSHRFTILGDCSFEYDCILLREPENNVVSLRMEGAENYDFFLQPNFIKEPFLKGSYAVYKKDTLIGEGTGKLCHIHRPEIIDARGRRCWGDLSVVSNELRITIPEWFLSEAKYPVVVDPTVGTETVGSLGYPEFTSDYSSGMVYEFGANRFLATEKIKGQCTAWAYLSALGNSSEHSYHPRIFDDVNNKPLTVRSCNEGNVVWKRRLYNNGQVTENPPEWKFADFGVIDEIDNGSYFWFGGYGDVFYPRYDYGGIFCKNYRLMEMIREPELIYDPDDDEWYEDGEEWEENPDFQQDGKEKLFNFIISWYFTFQSSSHDYMLTLTQGVELTDNRKLIGNYKRYVVQTAKVNSSLKRFETYFRKCVMSVKNSMTISRLPLFLIKLTEQVKVALSKNEIISLIRKCADEVNFFSFTKRIHNTLRNIQDGLRVLDTQYISVLFLRSVNNTAIAKEFSRHLGSFIRGLLITAGSTAETEHIAVYERKQADFVHGDVKINRGLLLFIRIVTQVFIRDYLLRRFLKAREELVLKSAVCREIIMESKID